MINMIIDLLPDPEKRLQEILSTMDVPVRRKNDINWLARNLSIKNSDHPQLSDALFIIEGLLLDAIRKEIEG